MVGEGDRGRRVNREGEMGRWMSRVECFQTVCPESIVSTQAVPEKRGRSDDSDEASAR